MYELEMPFLFPKNPSVASVKITVKGPVKVTTCIILVF